MQSFLVNCIGSFLLAITSILCVYYLPGTMDLNVIIIASIMPLVPGVAITNAVYDTLHGDYISGAARMLEAFCNRCGHRNRRGTWHAVAPSAGAVEKTDTEKKMRLKQKYENSR